MFSLNARLFTALLYILLLCPVALAQPPGFGGDEEGQGNPAAGALGCVMCVGCVAVLVTGFIGNILMLVLVARDAKARGMDNAVLWMMFVFITGPIALLIYFLSRSQGELAKCASCGNNRLAISRVCPHCGNQ